MGRSAYDPVCSMVGLSGCVFVVVRLCRLGLVLGLGVVLCWLVGSALMKSVDIVSHGRCGSSSGFSIPNGTCWIGLMR